LVEKLRRDQEMQRFMALAIPPVMQVLLRMETEDTHRHREILKQLELLQEMQGELLNSSQPDPQKELLELAGPLMPML
jgi:hypothetical protein